MATAREKRASILNFNRGDDWVSPAERRLLEEQRLLQEEEDQARIEQRGSPNTRGRYRPLDEAAPEEEQGILGSLVDRIQGGVQGSAAGAVGTAGDSSNPFISTLAALPGTLAALGEGDFNSIIDRSQSNSEAALDDSARLVEAQEANEAALKPAYDAFMEERGWLGRQATEAVFDAAGSPSGALSVIGGPVAAIGIADVYGQTYAEMRREGFSKEDATTRATMQAAPEMIGFLPSGKLVSKMPGYDKVVKELTSEISNKFVRGGTNIATGVAGEAIEEGLTQVGQFEADRVLAALGNSPELRKYAAEQTPENLTDYFDQVWRSAKAGGVFGGAIQTPTVVMQEIADAGKVAAKIEDVAIKADLRTTERTNAIQPQPIPEAPAYTPGPLEVQTRDQEEAMFRTMENEQAISALNLTPEAAQDIIATEDLSVSPEQIRDERIAAMPTSMRRVAEIEAQRQGPAVPVVGPSVGGIPSPTAATPRRRRGRAAAPVAPAVEGEVDVGPTSELDALREFASLPMEKKVPAAQKLASVGNVVAPNSPTAGGAIRAVRDKLGNKNTNALAKLITDGNIEVVDTATEVPGDAVQSGMGFYTGDKVYVVASALNPDNIVGDMLNVAAHEVKHEADLGGNNVKATLGGFIGARANDQFVRRIEAAATSGNATAKAAVDRARAGSTADTYALELPAYFINEQRDARDAKGSMARLAQNITGAVRTTFNGRNKSDFDINLDDVAYLSDKLIQEAALSPERQSVDIAGAPLPMVQGESTEGFAQAEREGRVYTDPADGKRKYLTSDVDATLRMNRTTRTALEAGRSVSVRDILDYEQLYNDYPKLATAAVNVIPEMGFGASYNESTNTVALGSRLADGIARATPWAKGTILHELQHGIQGVEDFARGGNPEQFLTPEDKGVIAKAEYVEERLNTQADLLDTMLPLIKKRMVRMSVKEGLDARASGAISAKEAFTGIIDDLMLGEYDGPDGVPEIRDWMNQTSALMALASEYSPQRTAANERALEKYNSLRGEQEAYFVGDNADVPLENLPLTPLNDARYAAEPRVSQAIGDIRESVDSEVAALAGADEGAYRVPAVSSGLVPAETVAPVMYRETNPWGAIQLLEGMETSMGGVTGRQSNFVFASNDPDMALGQGANRGIMVELDSAGFDARQSNSKPAAAVLNAQGVGEYELTPKITTAGGTENSGSHVRSITTAKGWRKGQDAAYAERLMLRMKQRGWPMAENADGSRTYSNPAFTAEQTVAPTERAAPLAMSGRTTPAPVARGLQSIRSFERRVENSPWNKKINKVVRGLGLWTGGLDRELAVGREESVGLAASYAHKAMNHHANIEHQIELMASRGVREKKYKNAKEGRAKIRADLEKRLDAIAKLPNWQRRESALASLVREQPYYAPVAKAYNEIHQLTKQLVGQMLENNPNPTPKQNALMTTMMNNSFGYSTRMYAAFQGAEGRSFSRKMQNEWMAAREALANGNEVPPKFKKAFQTYEQGLDFIIQNDLSIPDDWADVTTDKVNKLYDTWIGNAADQRARYMQEALDAGMTQAQAREEATMNMIERLEARRAPTVAEFEGKALDIINGMLGLAEANSPFANYYRGFRQDRSILERRDRVPEPIKELFGEITDPSVRLSVTIAKQGELAARTRLLLDMRDQGLGKWVVEQQDAGLPGNENFSVSLDGETYGPLAGYRTTPEIAAAISENLEMFTSMSDSIAQSYIDASKVGKRVAEGATGLLQGAAGLQKLSSIVFEAFGITMNAAGSGIMLMANGVTSPRTIYRAMGTGVESVIDVASGARGELSRDLDEAIRYGILDSARVQEIRRNPQKFVQSLITSKPDALVGTLAAGRTVKNTIVEAFAMSDAWVKMAAFKDRVNMLTTFYNGSKTEAEIKTEAADTIKDTNITYGRVPPVLRSVESLGLTAFMPYFYSVPRSLFYNNVVAYRDFARAFTAPTREGKMAMGMSAIKRLAGTQAATFGMVYGLQALATALNGEDEEKMQEIMKVLRPDARFAAGVYLGEDKQGNPLFFRLARVDPYGPVNDALRMLLDDSIPPEEAGRHALDAIIGLSFRNRFTATAISATADALTDEKIRDRATRLERIAPEQVQWVKNLVTGTGMDYSTVNSILAVLDTFTPGFVDALDPNNPKLENAKADELAILGNFATWTGGRLDKADPSSYAAQVGFEVKDLKSAARKQIADSVAAGRPVEEMLPIIMKADQELYDRQTALIDLYEGMTKGLDYSPTKAKAVLKDSASLTATELAAVTRGRASDEAMEDLLKRSGLVSKSSLEQRAENSERTMTPEERKEKKKEREQFLKNLRSLGYKIGE